LLALPFGSERCLTVFAFIVETLSARSPYLNTRNWHRPGVNDCASSWFIQGMFKKVLISASAISSARQGCFGRRRKLVHVRGNSSSVDLLLRRPSNRGGGARQAARSAGNFPLKLARITRAEDHSPVPSS
jgi:hypothetical protein